MNQEESPPQEISTLHLINDVPYQGEDGLVRMVTEIPAGTNEKWHTDAATGRLAHEIRDGQPRIIRYLPYPFNYGFVPQTLSSKEKGGDGDALDILLLAPAQTRGALLLVKVLGLMKLVQNGEMDIKIIAALPGEPMSETNDLPALMLRYPGTVEIVRLWFDGLQKHLFQGYGDRREALEIIESAHQDWLSSRNG